MRPKKKLGRITERKIGEMLTIIEIGYMGLITLHSLLLCTSGTSHSKKPARVRLPSLGSGSDPGEEHRRKQSLSRQWRIYLGDGVQDKHASRATAHRMERHRQSRQWGDGSRTSVRMEETGSEGEAQGGTRGPGLGAATTAPPRVQMKAKKGGEGSSEKVRKKVLINELIDQLIYMK